jgi:hypothetical protein
MDLQSCIAGALAAALLATPSPLTARSIAYQRAPEFPSQLIWLNGGPLEPAALTGRVLLIKLVEGRPEEAAGSLGKLQSIYETYRPRNLFIVGIYAPTDSGDALKALLHANGTRFRVALDTPERAVWHAYGSPPSPATFLIGGDRRIVFRQGGDKNLPDLTRAIEQALQAATPKEH